jgi:peptidoglycan/LPS O-acetylase OafA/YrhL
MLLSLLLAMLVYHYFSAPIIKRGRDRLKREAKLKNVARLL